MITRSESANTISQISMLEGEKIKAVIPYPNADQYVMVIFESGATASIRINSGNIGLNDIKSSEVVIKNAFEIARRQYDSAKKILEMSIIDNAPEEVK